jgi:hypothetical protein
VSSSSTQIRHECTNARSRRALEGWLVVVRDATRAWYDRNPSRKSHSVAQRRARVNPRSRTQTDATAIAVDCQQDFRKNRAVFR